MTITSDRHGGALERAAAEIVRRQGGTWTSRGAMCRCPAHDDRSPSLSVRIGRRSLLFKCFAGCHTHDVLRALGRLGSAVPTASAPRPSPEAIGAQGRASLVHRLWATGWPLGQCPGARYLASRGIADEHGVLRFHPSVQLGPTTSAIHRPALLAPVRDGVDLVAVQRIFLDPGGHLARDIDPPRRLLGCPGAGCVRLAPAGDRLGLAEGIETALSAMQLLGLPVWATLGNERFAHVAIPASVTQLVLLPDNDRAGRIAEELARPRHAADGRSIETIWPWHRLNDWNDVLRQEGRGRGSGAVQVS